MAHFVGSFPIPSDQTCGDEATQPALVSGQTMTVKTTGIGHPANCNSTNATHTKTYTIPKLTLGGKTGTITFTNGQVTAYVAPT